METLLLLFIGAFFGVVISVIVVKQQKRSTHPRLPGGTVKLPPRDPDDDYNEEDEA